MPENNWCSRDFERPEGPFRAAEPPAFPEKRADGMRPRSTYKLHQLAIRHYARLPNMNSSIQSIWAAIM